MHATLADIMQLLEEAARLLQTGSASDRSSAGRKLERVAALASTMALTLKVRR
jgi:hypothetical protein